MLHPLISNDILKYALVKRAENWYKDATREIDTII